MSHQDDTSRSGWAGKGVSRRGILKAGLGVAALPIAGSLFGRSAFAQLGSDFKTGADIAKAEAEGELVFYTHDSGAAAAAICEAFHSDFPKITARYVQMQNGALFAKILAERSAGRFDTDVIQFSELATALDFQKRGGFELYNSPQASGYAPGHLSTPAGYFFWVGMSFAGIAYNHDKVKPEDAPKNWKDLLDPKWKNAISVKQATSGMQFVQWYELRKLYGDDYWKKFSALQPKGFDSRVQLYDRLARGDDKVTALAEWAGYTLAKKKNAPVTFVVPPDGLPAAPLANGVVDKAPHPQAARLFVDWLMSVRGQEFYQTNAYLTYGSVRKDVPPMPGGMRLADFKLLIPDHTPEYEKSHDQFVADWNKMLGLL